ncbi:MAG: c-type cytochrome [bacterium]|nr:c-type cytochrome [bacterium]
MSAEQQVPAKERQAFRGPVDLVLAKDGSWAATANELSGTVSLIDLSKGRIEDEHVCGEKPGCIVPFGDRGFLVTCRDSGELVHYRIDSRRLREVARIHVGYEPLGIASNGKQVFVGLQATGEIAEINLDDQRVTRKFPVGVWPRYLDISEDGQRLAVGLSGQSCIAVVDTTSAEILYEEPLSGGINIGHLRISADGSQVYFPWMIYRSNPITDFDIQRGWVLASRIARIRMDGPAYREAISLDVPRKAVADPFGLTITTDETRLVVSSSGTHELLVYRLPDLPFQGAGGPGDLIDPRLLKDPDLFFRIELGGRPMGMENGADADTVWVANHLRDSIQQIRLSERRVVQEISLGSTPEDETQKQVHQGMAIFYDAQRSLDQWYSCHSCHLDGGTNAKAMDTWNDGSELTTKTVLPLTGVTETGPWTWHGWQQDLDASLANSFVSTMQGPPAPPEDIAALRAYLSTLRLPANPFVGADGELDESAARGKMLFEREDVGCSQCHSGERFTDGLIHDVGLAGERDQYEGYNTPSLRGVYRKPRLLHDGRAKTLQDVLLEWHRPQDIGGGAELSEQELADLVAYLKTL